jgi:hypothetical protein
MRDRDRCETFCLYLLALRFGISRSVGLVRRTWPNILEWLNRDVSWFLRANRVALDQLLYECMSRNVSGIGHRHLYQGARGTLLRFRNVRMIACRDRLVPWSSRVLRVSALHSQRFVDECE